MNLSHKKVLTFDCYGTLIDWETGILEALKPIFTRSKMVISEDEILLQFGNSEHLVQQEYPQLLYKDVLEKVLQNMSKNFDLEIQSEELYSFSHSIGNWRPFPDTEEALQKLSKYFKLIIVSNIDNESIELTKKHLNVPFYRTFTAQEMKAYKPDLKVFEYVFEALSKEEIDQSEILHVAESLFHDHVPAQILKMNSVWINRRFNKSGSGATPGVDPKYIPAYQFESLASFSAWVEEEMSRSVQN